MRRSLVLASLASLASFASVAGSASLAGCGSSSSEAPQPTKDAGTGVDPSTFVAVTPSCAFDCPAGACAEDKTPFACQNLGAWAQLPHADACAAWDGKYPAATKGQCTSSAPSSEAAKYTGPDAEHPGVTILPDGRRIQPAGVEWILREKDTPSGLPTNVIAVPGSSYALTVDTGYGPHVVRVIDTGKMLAPSADSPVVSSVRFDDPASLNSGIVFVPPDLVYVSTDTGAVQALKLDVATGALAKDDARSIKLPPSHNPGGSPGNWYVSGVAVTPDGKRLVVSAVKEKAILVYDVGAGSATFGAQLGSVDLGTNETFGVFLDPHDKGGRYAYASLWANRAVAEIDLGDPKDAKPVMKVTRTFATEKNPEGLTFLDARFMVVASDLGDSLQLVDRVSGTVTTVSIADDPKLHGTEPSMLTYDEASKRLYATLAGDNAIEALSVDASSSPPTLTPLGRVPTAWWPSAVAVMADGALAIVNMRGRGIGPLGTHFSSIDGDVMSGVKGSIQRVGRPSLDELVAGAKLVAANDGVSKLAGAPAVSCPPSVSDFPLPATNTEGASKKIDHVFFVVRENKTFDGVLGDLPGLEGKADLALKPGAMDALWGNFRALVKTFATSDNYYTSAELSIQGHVWTTHGRTNDYVERTWAMDGDGRAGRAQPGGIPEANTLEIAAPVEGSIFDWLADNKVPYNILGEAAGLPRSRPGVASPLDLAYPGFVQAIGWPDVEKSCYVAGRVRVTCDLQPFVYMLLMNDHTQGVSPTKPSPETMIAVNDEATGMLVDAVSHSPIWASSLIVVVEDDPALGADHIDNHRSPIALISPWVKRGYVSKTHIDISSVHKLFAHLLGVPYPSNVVANAALPFDAFSSTPDYTPYTYAPRPSASVCGLGATAAERRLTDSWDLTRADAQPGLDAQVARWLRGEQLQTLTDAMRASLERREQQRAAGLPEIHDDDD